MKMCDFIDGKGQAGGAMWVLAFLNISAGLVMFCIGMCSDDCNKSNVFHIVNIIFCGAAGWYNFHLKVHPILLCMTFLHVFIGSRTLLMEFQENLIDAFMLENFLCELIKL